MARGLPFPVDPELTGIVIAYHNADMIADRVLPKLPGRLMRYEFKYMKFDFAEGITIRDTKVGRKSEPQTLEFSATEVTASVEDYGLDDLIPNRDVEQAPANYDPRAFAAQRLIDLVELDREVRVANKVFNAATYAAANKTQLSGASQWSNSASDPLADIMTVQDGLVMRANKLLLGRSSWTALRRHPKILQAISISGTDKGAATIQAVQDLLEIDEIIVGSAFVNSAKPGQTPVRSRTWGKHALLFRQERVSTTTDGMPTFGYTAQYGERVSGSIDEPKVGLRGSVRVRAGETVGEVICAPDLGYFFQDAVA